MTHWKKLTNPNYLGAYSIEDGKDLILTIGTVAEETVVGTDGKKEDRVVCHFLERNTKPMILNSTNMKMITKLLGTPFIEEWHGHKIQIGIEKVKAFGEIVEALRVRKFLPQIKSEPALKCEQCGADIKGIGNMTPEKVAAYTKQKYGQALCSDCATAKANESKTEEKENVTDGQKDADE